jgi:REP element-mobilizing transposase RayT
MPNTYSQIYIHAVFAVKFRENIITHDWRDNLHKYISRILKEESTFPLAVGGWIDHVHVFFSMPPSKSVSEVMRVIKSNSSKWINEEKFVKGKFQWQEGFGAFSNSKSEIDNVIKYIINQEEHHTGKSFKAEYLQLLRKYQIAFDDKYLFEFYE